jgi:hypothetical protein
VAVGEYGVQKSTSVTPTAAVAETARHTIDITSTKPGCSLSSPTFIASCWRAGSREQLDPTNRRRPSVMDLRSGRHQHHMDPVGIACRNSTSFKPGSLCFWRSAAMERATDPSSGIGPSPRGDLAIHLIFRLKIPSGYPRTCCVSNQISFDMSLHNSWSFLDSYVRPTRCGLWLLRQ